MGDKYYEFVYSKVKQKTDVEEGLSLVKLCKLHLKLYPGLLKMFPYPTLAEATKYAKDLYNRSNKKKKQNKNKVSYKEYIKSEKWKKKVAYIKEVRNNRCEVCGNKENLQVHHLTYKRLGKEKDEDLQLLCGGCHMKAHLIGEKEEDIMKHIIEISK